MKEMNQEQQEKNLHTTLANPGASIEPNEQPKSSW